MAGLLAKSAGVPLCKLLIQHHQLIAHCLSLFSTMCLLQHALIAAQLRRLAVWKLTNRCRFAQAEQF